MADKTKDNVDTTPECELKEKEVVDSPTKNEDSNDKVEKENGDVCDGENGKADAGDEVDSKESDSVCPIKRKSVGGGGDAPDGTPAEGVSPEKKAKLDDAVADAESNGEAEVAA